MTPTIAIVPPPVSEIGKSREETSKVKEKQATHSDLS
jgi:hypothetical protein